MSDPDTVTYRPCWIVVVYEQTRALANDNIGRMGKRVLFRDMIGQPAIEEINDNFLRDAIESIAQYYIFLYPGDASMSYYLSHTCAIIILTHKLTILFATHTCTVTILSD